MEWRLCLWLGLALPLPPPHAHALLSPADARFVADFFADKHIRIVALHTCSDDDSKQLSKLLLNTYNVWVVNLNKDNGINASMPTITADYYRTGLFVDYTCQDGQLFLNQSEAAACARLWSLVWGGEAPRAGQLPLSPRALLWWASAADRPPSLARLYRLPGSDAHHVLPPHLPYPVNFQRATLSVGMLAERNADGTWEIPEENRRLYSMTKFNEALLLHLQELYNFTVRVLPVEKWGSADAHGRYDGLLGLLQRGEAQLGLSSLVPQPHHLDAATFIGPAWRVRTLALVRQPSRAGAADALVQPLTPAAWLCCGLLLAALAAGLRAATWAHRRFLQSQQQSLEDSWSDSLLLVIGAISEQGTANDSSQPSWRLVVLLTFTLSLLMNTYYSASMTVTLLLPPPVVYRTLADMARSDVRLALHNTPDMINLLQDPLLQQLRRADRLSLSALGPALQRARADSARVATAAAADAAVLYAALSPSDRCALSEVPLFPPHHSLLPLAKGSPLKELLSVGLRRCWERGVSRRLEGVWLARAAECVAVARPGGVRLQGVLPALALLLLGAALAALLLAAETRWPHRRLKSTEEPQQVKKKQAVATIFVREVNAAAAAPPKPSPKKLGILKRRKAAHKQPTVHFD